MTIKQATERARLTETLSSLGFTFDEAQSLIRIEMTLHRWAEHECNGNIQNTEDDGSGKSCWYTPDGEFSHFIPDRERGALKRLEKIIGERNKRVGDAAGLEDYVAVSHYHQTDPRGAALYLLRDGGDGSTADVREGEDPSSVYNRGICVCGR